MTCTCLTCSMRAPLPTTIPQHLHQRLHIRHPGRVVCHLIDFLRQYKRSIHFRRRSFNSHFSTGTFARHRGICPQPLRGSGGLQNFCRINISVACCHSGNYTVIPPHVCGWSQCKHVERVVAPQDGFSLKTASNLLPTSCERIQEKKKSTLLLNTHKKKRTENEADILADKRLFTTASIFIPVVRTGQPRGSK